MRKKLWITLVLLLVIPGLLFTVSCAKKTVKSDAALEKQQAEEEALRQKREAEERARQEEMARQRALEEERLREEARRKEMAAKNRFLNEDIHFEFDSSVLLPDAQEILKLKAEWLRLNSMVRVVVEGHCDERGTNEYSRREFYFWKRLEGRIQEEMVNWAGISVCRTSNIKTTTRSRLNAGGTLPFLPIA